MTCPGLKNIFPPEEIINNLKIKRYPSNWFGFSPSIDWLNTDVVALHNFDVIFVRFLFKAYLLKLFHKKKFALIPKPQELTLILPNWLEFRFVSKKLRLSIFLFHQTIMIV